MFYNIEKRQRPSGNLAALEPTPSEAGIERLKAAMLSDKSSASAKLIGVIKSDVYLMLLNYMDVRPENIKLEIRCEGGGFVLEIKAAAERILNLSTV